ncbi:uncharacterized protein TNIN_124391 [Trichonephila inaurata madagascariensis]|uniref:Uncharacterized protein n=1 Tax=Trichonephila inaurata madagascariensis TaxID=2747483 RepID=A0A8X6MM22_9ARAC|nr:uncharacterized protein TNIN_124391 [Trichonephila inaurata madagascariensis]
MCSSKLALMVFNDRDVVLFTSTHNIHTCIWTSEEIEAFLGEKSATSLYNAQLLEILSKGVKPTLSQEQKHLFTGDGKDHSLPCKEWELLVDQKLSTLTLPNMFKKEITALVKLVVIETFKWLRDHERILKSTTIFPNHLHWTQDNKIDRQKTAKEIIADDNIDIKNRLILALSYCFEDDAFSLWRKLSYRQQCSYAKERHFEMIITWLPWLTDGVELNWDEYALKYGRNYFGLRTFLPKMRQEKRLECVLRIRRGNWIDYHELQCLLSVLDQNQQNEFLKNYAFQILKVFLDWPLQDKILDVIELLWPYLSVENLLDFSDLILCQKRLFNAIGYDYVTLLKKLWKRVPFGYSTSIEGYSLFKTLKLILEYDESRPFLHELCVRSNDDNFMAVHAGTTVFVFIKCDLSRVRFTFHRLFKLYSIGNSVSIIQD